jgi:hypothetical protein
MGARDHARKMGWQSMKCAGSYADMLAGDGWQLLAGYQRLCAAFGDQ